MCQSHLEIECSGDQMCQTRLEIKCSGDQVCQGHLEIKCVGDRMCRRSQIPGDQVCLEIKCVSAVYERSL